MSSLETDLAPLRIPFEDILLATNDFAEENRLDEGGIADVYKGLLLRSEVWMDVVIRRFCRPCPGLGKIHFLREIHTLYHLKHRNIVSIVGFCDENDEMMIIMEHAVNGSLEKHLSDPTTLTWSQRLHICVGAALALRYIHTNINHFGSHHDIKSSKILLDKDWEAKVFCFGFHVSHRVVFHYTSTYTDPDYIKTGTTGKKKSNVYSLGVILLEVLCGSKATMEVVNQYASQMEEIHYEEGKLDDIIDLNLRKQMCTHSLSIFSETAYKCVKEQPYKRPDINQVVESLKEALELQLKHENLVRLRVIVV
ncbi:putative protein kinase RLK-Pelle-CrRLK1L-1 family [Helianthus annuus]|uniref:Protein kinase domain-containing protein n=1 Tax=Helianthus annuus TaxID=4232 RepID=A0A251V3Y3_HELAN|nr:receptor-like protein kinase HERK 1 [Helianthus annuus]KAF5812811.1 putative protein kinase RLK-Pelle-CrRLK1L-1 family [Helianthus annuus]KAJ0606624.1 putative protein kinase RLK-Pelle-CrRLK1L-1 family [Helianthus annuus]KAJ0766682.1 putative protein kinase RLK-Pelle-CrRLK1L-1 family [Helianthus annuus]KAJ0933958.1 putative protein kinase RLK-Pelle-CrRLK1L-1 family [Helianthus annuus]KAJ0942040.1 putative protein kinase RLK-Pelle-CrRLK1L-1 family [Helianthus annuus]